MGGRREVSIISHRPLTSSDLKQERSFFRGSVSTFLQLVVATSVKFQAFKLREGAKRCIAVMGIPFAGAPPPLLLLCRCRCVRVGGISETSHHTPSAVFRNWVRIRHNSF